MLFELAERRRLDISRFNFGVDKCYYAEYKDKINKADDTIFNSAFVIPDMYDGKGIIVIVDTFIPEALMDILIDCSKEAVEQYLQIYHDAEKITYYEEAILEIKD